MKMSSAIFDESAYRSLQTLLNLAVDYDVLRIIALLNEKRKCYQSHQSAEIGGNQAKTKHDCIIFGGWSGIFRKNSALYRNLHLRTIFAQIFLSFANSLLFLMLKFRRMHLSTLDPVASFYTANNDLLNN